jgi:polynucleotide 5'-hydroxyl-kinase GRC3/NOL9
MEIPGAWEQIDLAGLRGVLIVIGAPDVGKSTFAQYLYRRLCAESRRTAFLDGDPGQSALGPPATMTLAMGRAGEDAWPPSGQTWRRFVGAVSPVRHMLPVLVGAARLVQAAQDAGAEVIIYDTTGLVNPMQGGPALKLAKVDLLRPTVVFGIQRDRELEPVLAPLRHSRVRVVELRPSPAVQPRDLLTRQAHRASQFARAFSAARPVRVDWKKLAVSPSPRFVFNQLVALEDAEGFTLGLGIVVSSDPALGQVRLLTSLDSMTHVQALRLGDVLVDPKTFRDQPLA